MLERRQRYFLLGFDLFTIIFWGLIFAEFLTKGTWETPSALTELYLIVLVFYAGDKEIRRWRKLYISRDRHGEYFVLGWSMTLVVMLGIELISGSKLGYTLPHDMPLLTSAVLVIFFVTEYLKKEFRRR